MGLMLCFLVLFFLTSSSVIYIRMSARASACVCICFSYANSLHSHSTEKSKRGKKYVKVEQNLHFHSTIHGIKRSLSFLVNGVLLVLGVGHFNFRMYNCIE